MTSVETPYIHCDCSDCGFSRIRGPCYLEEFHHDKDNYFLNEERQRQQETFEYKCYSNMCEKVAGDKRHYVSVTHITMV